MGIGFGAVVSSDCAVQLHRNICISDGCFVKNILPTACRGAVRYTIGATQRRQNQSQSDLRTPRPSNSFGGF